MASSIWGSSTGRPEVPLPVAMICSNASVVERSWPPLSSTTFQPRLSPPANHLCGCPSRVDVAACPARRYSVGWRFALSMRFFRPLRPPRTSLPVNVPTRERSRGVECKLYVCGAQCSPASSAALSAAFRPQVPNLNATDPPIKARLTGPGCAFAR